MVTLFSLLSIDTFSVQVLQHAAKRILLVVLGY